MIHVASLMRSQKILAHVNMPQSVSMEPGLWGARPKAARGFRGFGERGLGFGLGSGSRGLTVDFTKLEYGYGTMYAGFPSSQAFGVGGQLCSNCLASTVG